jgi:hypothetical protein
MDLLLSLSILSRAPRPLEANLAPLVAAPMQRVRSDWTWCYGPGLGGFPSLGNRVNRAVFGPLSRFLLGQITYVTERYRG